MMLNLFSPSGLRPRFLTTQVVRVTCFYCLGSNDEMVRSPECSTCQPTGRAFSKSSLLRPAFHLITTIPVPASFRRRPYPSRKRAARSAFRAGAPRTFWNWCGKAPRHTGLLLPCGHQDRPIAVGLHGAHQAGRLHLFHEPGGAVVADPEVALNGGDRGTAGADD